MKSGYLLLLLSWTPLAAQNAAQPFTIAISAPTPIVKAGSDVWVIVKITNHSTENLDESGSINGMTGLDPYLVFEVRDLRGDSIANKVYKRPELASGYPVNRSIKPGETLTEEQDVSRLYDMTHPGNYVVQVFRRSSEVKQSRSVKSNKVTIEVINETLK
jgi:hypothetical protein